MRFPVESSPVPTAEPDPLIKQAARGLTPAEEMQLGKEVARRVSVQRHAAVRALGKKGTASLSLPHGIKKHNGLRNKQCVCGSGRKFKVCCWRLYK